MLRTSIKLTENLIKRLKMVCENDFNVNLEINVRLLK